MKTTGNDSIYATPINSVDGFVFDHQVAEVFPDMISRSVPGYTTIVAMIGVLAERYATRGCNVYDLGCSLGAATLSMREKLNNTPCRIVAVDNSPAMIERCKHIIALDRSETEVELIQDDIQNVSIDNASVVVLNFTLQFLPINDRKSLLEKIYQGMNKGGILILSEKVKFADSDLQELNTDLHHAFKRANGYSDLEVAQKRTALENVLIPETLDEHQARLKAIGFSSTDVWFQCFNFASLVAIK